MNSPVWLKFVCIVSIILGGLGLAGSVVGIAGLLLADQVQGWSEQFVSGLQQGMPPQMQEVQEQLMAETTAIQRQWRPLQFSLYGSNLLVAGGLLVGGIQALRMKPAGRKILLAALTAAILFEVVRAVPTTIIQWQTAQLMGPYMERLMAASTPQGANLPPAQRQSMERMMRSTMVASTLFGLVATLSVMLVKIAFYAAGIWLLQRRQFRALYSQDLAVAEIVR